MEAEKTVTWSTWAELLLGGAVSRHGIEDWTVIASQLKTRTVSPCIFTPEVCKAKYEELQQQYPGDCMNWYEELKKKRVAELKRELELSEEIIGSLKLKIEFLQAGRNEKRDGCRVDNDAVGPELHVPCKKLDIVDAYAKETSKDGLSAGSFTHETKTNWTNECQVPAMSREDVETKAEVSESAEQKNVLNEDRSAHTVYKGLGGFLRKPRGKRKRRECCRSINEVSVRESDFSADVCKETSTSNCGEIAKLFGMNRENANLKNHGIKELMEILDSFLAVQGASAFSCMHESQKRGRYKKLIRQHMDFDTIRSRIHNRTIKSVVELSRDLLLLSNNALAFYSKLTHEHRTAQQLRDLAMKTMAEKLKCSSTSRARDPSEKVRSIPSSTSPVRDPSVKVKSMRPGNRKIVAKVAGGSSSAERVSVGVKKSNKVDSLPAEKVSVGVKKANKVDSPPSVESLPIKKAFGGRKKKVERESAGQRHTIPRNEKKKKRAK